MGGGYARNIAPAGTSYLEVVVSVVELDEELYQGLGPGLGHPATDLQAVP